MSRTLDEHSESIGRMRFAIEFLWRNPKLDIAQEMAIEAIARYDATLAKIGAVKAEPHDPE